MKDPLVAPLACFAGGIVLAHFVRFGVRESVLALAALAGLAVLAGFRRARVLTLVCAGLALVSGGILDAVLHRPGPPPELDAGPQETVILSGCVVEPSTLYQNREQFTLELDPGARARVSFNLRDGEQAPALSYGQRVEIDAHVRRPRNFRNPGAFDYAGFLARQQIYWTASIPHGGRISVLGGRCGSRLAAAIFALRAAALAGIERLYAGSPYSTGMLEATLIGSTDKLEKNWTENFRRTGTYHVLVIAGLHITATAACLLFLLRVLMVPEFAALAAAAVAAWTYALVCGGATPAIRAAAGFTLYLAGRFFFRRRRILNLLAAVALAFLFIDPAQLFDAAFQLSFLSVAAIGALAEPLFEATSSPYARGLHDPADRNFDLRVPPRVARFRLELSLLAETVRLWSRIPDRWTLRGLALFARLIFFSYEMTMLSAIFQIGLALPMAVYFHRISFSGVSANVLIVPLMTAIIPVGFLAIFTGWSWPALLAHWLLESSKALADWHAGWEPFWRIPDPPLWLALAFVASLLALAFAVRARARWRWPSLGVTLALFGLLLWQPVPPAIERGRLELTAIDVGQGDSLLMVLPDGKLMLIDGGGIPAFGNRPKPRLDTGEDVVSPYLWSRSIHRLDVLAMTHAHDDHVGGIPALLENFRPRELWTGATPASGIWSRIVDTACQVGTRIVPLDDRTHLSLGGARIDVLSPPEGYRPSAQPTNNDSLVLRVVFGKTAFLLTGDIEKGMEARLIADGGLSHVDVLKVAHHGSHTSSTAPFLNLARPEVALISAGQDNPFHHPHADVVERLEQDHAEVFRTDVSGLITVRSDGRRLSVDTMSWAGSDIHPLSAF